MLARDKEYITLYRGKDFLPAAVSSAIEERRKQAIREKHRKDFNSQVADVKELTQSREAVQPIVEFASENENTGKNNKNVVPGKKKLNSTEAAIERTTNKLKDVCNYSSCVCLLLCLLLSASQGINISMSGTGKES